MDGKINILGVNITNIDKNKLKKNISEIVNGNKFNYIVTLNPEILLKAAKDEELFYVVNSADFVPADGIGLKFAALLTGKIIPRITGVEITEIIFDHCASLNKKILIVRWENSLSGRTDIETAVKKHYPDLNFLVHSMRREKEYWPGILHNQEIINFQPDVLFCLFGAPFQEKFIYHIAKKIPQVKLAIGVGGAFDFLTEKIKRAPRLLRAIGLEWFWRLAKQPKIRWKRISNAIAVFPYRFLIWRFILPFFYRKNIACLLFKKENKQRYILLVERQGNPGYWQLPQGGIDGEDLATAGDRELREEINCPDFKFIAIYKNLYKYKFGQRNEGDEYAQNVQKHCGYKGQKQSLYIAEFIGKDKDIKVNFWEHTDWKWVPAERFLETVHACRKEAARIYMDIFSKLDV